MAAIKILSVDDEAPIELLMKQYFRRKIKQVSMSFSLPVMVWKLLPS